MVKCGLCGEDVPSDDKGIGGTLMVVHAHDHQEEMEKLGMNMKQYEEYCKNKKR